MSVKLPLALWKRAFLLTDPDSSVDIERFTKDHEFYKTFRKGIEQQMNENFAASVKGSQAQADGREVRISEI